MSPEAFIKAVSGKGPGYGGRLPGGDTYVFTTPAQYREMKLATPDAVNPVHICGSGAYYYDSDYDHHKGVFLENHTVRLTPFRIAAYETTYELWYEVKQWAVRGAKGYVFANAGREGHDGTDGTAPTSGKTEPVTHINWRDAVVWCNAYSEISGKEPVYYTDAGYTTVLRISTNDTGTDTAADRAVMKPGAEGYRLPTEVQWEYAARGGGTPDPAGPFADKWAGTDTPTDLGNYAWYSPNSSDATHPVGRRMPNALGLNDMAGNVWEWCWDWYHGNADGTGAVPGTSRVIRGGGWNSDASECAVSRRNINFPDYGYGFLGFRVACP